MAEVAAGNVDGVLADVRELAQALIAPGAAGVDRESRFPDEQLSALGQAGALGLLVPREHGGAGAGLVALARACEVVGGACASTGMVFLMHCVTTATVTGGGGESAAQLLEGMASGEVLGTLAFSERGTGAHFYAPELRAERRDGSVRVSGRKAFVTSGGHADVMLVLLQGEGEGLDCYVVRRDAPGVRFDGRWEGLGMRGNSSIAVEFEDVVLDGDARIGDSGDEGALVPLKEAKALCTDVAARVTQGALEACGGQGYTPALPIERHLRDARAGAVMAPTNGVLRTWSGKAIAGLPVP
jgi:isovaleryl-CoA dehydrogenase